VSVHRRRRGFERAGRLPPREFDLPRARARELVLATSWRRVAGEPIAKHARAVGVRRGVLEIAVDDERWLAMLRPLLAGLAARLSTLCPELRVRKFRLHRADAGGSENSPAEPLGELPAESRSAASPEVDVRPEGVSSPAASWTERLESAMERHLARHPQRQ
jgi:predicted nucleic acid-binding Zn ribbon protein